MDISALILTINTALNIVILVKIMDLGKMPKPGESLLQKTLVRGFRRNKTKPIINSEEKAWFDEQESKQVKKDEF